MSTRVKTLTQHTFFAVALIALAGPLANLALWPRQQLPAVAPVKASDYFSPAFLTRANDFARPELLLGVASLLCLVLVPLALAWWWPRERAASASGKRRLLAAAGCGAAATAVALIVALPFDLAAFYRARDYGLEVQSNASWLQDWALNLVLVVGGIALLASVATALIRKLGKRWWMVFAAALIVFAILIQALSPVLIAPLFGNYSKLPPGPTRSEIQSIADAAHVKAGGIYEVDAGKRTTGANAYVTGLGRSKRVVIYDTLLHGFPDAERREVVAHELGHAHYNDLLHGLIWFAFVAIVSLYGVDKIARRLAARRGIAFEAPAAVVMLAAAAMLAVAISQPAANTLSRRIEARADAFALRVTKDPDAAIALERRLAITNLARPTSPKLLHWALGTHPTTLQRIGAAVTVKNEQR